MVDDSLIKETGSKVRCSNCSSVFVAYPQPPETDESQEFDLADLEEDDESFESEGLLDELELDLDDFDDELDQDAEPEIEDLADNIGDELEVDLDLDDDDDIDPVMFDDAGDELPDLSDFEGLAGLDDDSLTVDDTDEDNGFELNTETDATAENDETDLELESDGELNLTDLDFEAEDEAEVEAALNSEELGFGLELDQDDDAQTDGEMTATDLTVEGADRLDLTDLELELDDASISDDAADDAPGDLEFDLEEQPPQKAETAETGASLEDVDQLDLSDLELELDDDSAPDEAAAPVSGDLELGLNIGEDGESMIDGEEPDISDLKLELEDDDAADDSAAAAFDDLDLNLDDSAAAASDDLNLNLDEEDGLNLDLDEEADTVAAGQESGIDELDLSDLDDMIAAEDISGDQPGSPDAAENLELDLDLTPAEDAQPEDAGEAAANDLQLNVSDLVQITETVDTTNPEIAADNGADELDLDFNLDESSIEDADAPAAADADEAAPDDNLLDIEKMLAQGDDIESESANGEDEGLSLSMEETFDGASNAAEPDLDLDFDIESELQEREEPFDDISSDDDQLDSNLLVTDDLGFLDDAGTEDESRQDDGPTDEFSIDEFTDSQDAYGQTDVLPDIEDQMPEPAKPAKSRSKKPALAVLMILILAAGALILPRSLGINIPYLSDIKIPYLSDIKIPYLSDLLNPQEQDIAGSLKMNPMEQTISGQFVNNSKVGRLFVIRGKIKNEYDHPRSFVKVTGKLYKKGQKLVKSATVYCGNVIPESDLTRLDIAAINKRMKNKSGTRKSNRNIKTGKIVPFMIVFDKLPKNLDEYTVEVASSSI